MWIARLSLTDFRNHADTLLEVGPGLVVITGENGVGKTNVLEAVSLLAPGRGLRGSPLSEIARQDGPGGFAVAARTSPLCFRGGDGGGGGPITSDLPGAAMPPGHLPDPNPSPEEDGLNIGTGTTPAAPERRQVRINGVPASANSLAEWLSVLWLTPAMDRLFSDTASARRRFLDRLVLALEPGHATHAARYEAAMRARNKLLAQEEPPDPAWLASLEAAMAEHGSRVAEARQRTIDALAEVLGSQTDPSFPRAQVGLDQPPVAEGALKDLLRTQRERDAAAGRTLVGPHRVDLKVTHVAKAQPAEHCSTGEQKALLLGIILGHAELVAAHAGGAPILLLDEVAAHLDARRRAALFGRLEQWGGQVWMTGTDASLFDAVADGATRLHLA